MNRPVNGRNTSDCANLKACGPTFNAGLTRRGFLRLAVVGGVAVGAGFRAWGAEPGRGNVPTTT